ncbi:phage late control D family protein [Paenibacillus tyrfis]|uniref:Phage late control protein n=1 Tax=Paenibacillus tyrfis TaxID=1501230 RepID=A0A081NV31_9BACL|nr:contractile injection system protein, VgrG/Pvc8 family [Paenibacillus tyrfis]KEQ22304.1 hypothetical protein ET33_26385 [Paenibacillus tyrfis]
MNTRRAEIEIVYEGVNISQDIAPFLLSFSYTDNGTGKADDLQISLADWYQMWRDPWLPQNGDRIQANIILHHWEDYGTKVSLPCGTFQVDTVGFAGPPDTVDIKAASFPPVSGLKNEEKTKAWEKVTLSQIAKRIASYAGLNFMFETDDVTFDRVDQTQQTDLAFLDRLAEQEGLTLKVTNDSLVIFDDLKYESMPPVKALTRGKSDIKSYSFDLSAIDAAYGACQVSYTDGKGGRTISGTFRAPGDGPLLKINERVASQAEAIRKARKALRQKNKEAQKARMVLMGDPVLVQGVTVEVQGFGKFDNKYYIETATHTVGGNGYETSIELRKVLTY